MIQRSPPHRKGKRIPNNLEQTWDILTALSCSGCIAHRYVEIYKKVQSGGDRSAQMHCSFYFTMQIAMDWVVYRKVKFPDSPE